MDQSNNEVTRLLASIGEADRQAAEQLLPLVYDELKKLARHRMAQESPDHTLQPTALVHEAYLRLVGDSPADFAGRAQFFSAAAEAMRRILIEQARSKARVKRGGGRKKIQLDQIDAGTESPFEDWETLDEALQKLQEEDAAKAELVRLRFFAGLSEQEAAAVLGISRSTASRYWTYSRAWLFDYLNHAAQK